MAFKYVKKETARTKKTPGKSYVAKGKKPKLGSGKRFKALESNLEKKGYSKDSAAKITASIGRKKYGAKKMGSMSAKGRKKGK